MPLPIFPTLIGVAFPIVVRPVFSTETAEAASGLEVRVGNYVYPKKEWDIPVNYLNQDAAVADYQALYGLYVQMGGAFGTFLFDYDRDNSTNGVPSQIGIGDGTTTTFQLGRMMGAGFELVYDVNSLVAAPKIYLNTTLQSSGYSINSTGLITFSSAPGNGVLVKADFQYYWRVKFAEDSVDFSRIVDYWHQVSTLKLRQVKV